MTSQWPMGDDPKEPSLVDVTASVQQLSGRLDAIDTTLQARAVESEALSPLIERVVARVADIREMLRTFEPQLERAKADIQELREQSGVRSQNEEPSQETLDRLVQIEERLDTLDRPDDGAQQAALDRLAQLEQHLDTLDRPDDGAQQTALERLAQLEQRLDTLDQPDDGAQQAALDRLAQLEQRLDTLDRPDDGAQQAALDRLAQIEQRLDATAAEHENEAAQTRELLSEIEDRVRGLDESAQAESSGTAARLDKVEQPMESLSRLQDLELPAAVKRVEALEARLEALTTPGEALDVRAQTEGTSSSEATEESALQVLREESIGIAMASVNDLYRRVDQLDRQEEALSRIINLIVERSKLVPADDLTNDRGRSHQ